MSRRVRRVSAAPADAEGGSGRSRDRDGLRGLAGCPMCVEHEVEHCIGLKRTTANLRSDRFNVFARLEVRITRIALVVTVQKTKFWVSADRDPRSGMEVTRLSSTQSYISVAKRWDSRSPIKRSHRLPSAATSRSRSDSRTTTLRPTKRLTLLCSPTRQIRAARTHTT